MSPAWLARVYGTRKTRFAYSITISAFLPGLTGILVDVWDPWLYPENHRCSLDRLGWALQSLAQLLGEVLLNLLVLKDHELYASHI